MSHQTTHPQHGPALVLLALATEHGDLPPITWTLPACGGLFGTLHTTDATAVLVGAAWADALDAELLPVTYRTASGIPMCTLRLDTVWHDVRVQARFGCPAAMLPTIAEHATPVHTRRRRPTAVTA